MPVPDEIPDCVTVNITAVAVSGFTGRQDEGDAFDMKVVGDGTDVIVVEFCVHVSVPAIVDGGIPELMRTP